MLNAHNEAVVNSLQNIKQGTRQLFQLLFAQTGQKIKT